MVTLKTLDSSIISFIILVLIYINVYNRSEKVFMHYRLFIYMIQANMVLIIVDILAWVFNGLPGTLNLISNTGFNLLLYILVPVAPSLWVIYANFHIFRDEKRIFKATRVLVAFIVINAVISVMSLFTGWFFIVDTGNIYHRGEYFWVHVVYCYLLLVYSFFYVLINRSLIEKRHYYSLLLFFIPQTIGTSIQMLCYGVTYNWTGMMLSLLIIYFNIQDRGLNTDYLTGVYNRRQLDGYINGKIRNSADGKSFSAILIDLNDFKSINDKFGHETGDQALKDTVGILRKSLRLNDFVARFGGDEFVVIMDINNRELLKQAVNRIRSNIEEFNESSIKPYKLSFSMGYDIYDCNSKMKSDDFFNHIDTLMYNNKKQVLSVGRGEL
ncbi:GGDEF domain-containing protein [Desulfosporosinus hippei]|uniref:Diguanylate cyclase (GGDEF) domain-containing protein n=1 Tax=Desulfosporosinus hippei DSM 8344 TaxID=1121419 RepID=A0A1G8FCH0_9FIRM|nr:GGDEF domain-containing protein [Desulfosporosinus hippei]SDH79807.1 diguanylate cyclase (GGDEF) domain-containing protein [Desulfosporosinus hippei DSM 8344]